MATLSTLGQMMMNLPPQIQQYDPQQVALTQQRLQAGRLGQETALLQLADLKRQQEAEAQVMAAIQTNPALAQQLFGGGAVLGSLGPPPGAAPGAITQRPLGGGPLPPDVAAQGMPTVTPPQSTLASLGPQPQAPPNPLLEMARRDPRAALLLQRQMQAQQDRQAKLQEQQLDMGVKVSEAVARQLQGVTDQASLDEARERIRLIHPQAAAQLPQFYSKEAVASLQQRGMSVVEAAKARLDDAKARRLDIEMQYFPQMLEDTNAPLPGQAPAGGAGTTTTAGTRTITAPQAFEAAIADANRLYPQVSTTRITSIIAAESNFDPKAVSSAGAQGLMQLMPGTAKDMGVDDPFDITQNVRGGTRYYAQLLTRYGGDERKALAAYNWGPANLDKVGGDVSKAPPETQAYVQKVLGGGGGGTGAAQTGAADPRLAHLDAQIALRTRQAKQASLFGNESLSTRLNDEVNRLTAEKNRLVERSTEIPRAVEKETALQPLKVAQARAGAEVQLEGKMNEPIGIQAGDELDLPASTKWKDVPKDRKPMPRPGEGERKALSDLRASVAGVDSLLNKLDDPKIAGMIGTIFTEPPAAVQRLLGPWLATLAPEQRAFAATIAGEIMEIRHRLIGAGQTGIEVAALEPMMPSPADTDPATVRAKLTALRDGMLRRHDAKRDDLEGLGFRVPAKLARAEAPSGLTPAQEALLKKHTR